MILASHILHEIEAVNPSFLLISGGRLLASGSPEDVRTILSSAPTTLRIQTDQPRKLLSLIIDLPIIEGARVIEAGKNEPGFVEIDTKSSSGLLEHFPAIAAQENIKINEIQSADDSLKHLFTTLMRIHRGETKGGLV